MEDLTTSAKAPTAVVINAVVIRCTCGNPESHGYRCASGISSCEVVAIDAQGRLIGRVCSKPHVRNPCPKGTSDDLGTVAYGNRSWFKNLMFFIRTVVLGQRISALDVEGEKRQWKKLS